MASRKKTKGRTPGGRYIAIPHSVLEHPDYQALTGAAVKVLNYMLIQYNGSNNGDLSIVLHNMKKYGISSSDTLDSAKKQLVRRGLIIETRTGRFINPGGICALYAITWQPIDEGGGKLEVPATSKPVRAFSIENHHLKKTPCPVSGSKAPKNGAKDKE